MRINSKISYILISVIPFLFSSCATILNEKFQIIHVNCDSTLRLVHIDKATKTFDFDTAWLVKRSRQNLRMEFVLNDSSRVNYYLRSRLSKEFVFGNIYPFFPVAHIVDLCCPNRFAYRENNYFTYDTVRQKIIRKRQLYPDETKNIYMRFGWSFLNAYHASLFEEFYGEGTPLELNLQVEYFFKARHSVFFEGGTAVTFKKRHRLKYSKTDDLPESVLYGHAYSYWLLGGYRYHIKTLAFGAGVSWSPASYSSDKYYSTKRDTIGKNNTDSTYWTWLGPFSRTQNVQKMGLVFNLDCKVTSNISAGMNWHLFIKDIDKSTGIYSSHFFNFYLTFKLCRINFNKTKPPHEYNRSAQ
ncbi:MAG: hypothetical protein V4635_07640 [Bacteroidota bacterium]